MRTLLFAISLAFLIGCKATVKTKEVKTVGFLGDYSMMVKGDKDNGQLVYVNNEVDFKNYKKIIIEPIQVWKTVNNELSSEEKEELQKMVDYLYLAVKTNLEKNYDIVDEPAADTLRIKMALTQARESIIVGDVMSNIMPPLLVLGSIKTIATGVPFFTGQASFEGEMVDSQTGKRVMAVVDARSGMKRLRGKFDSWDDVKKTFDLWADRLELRLGELSK